MTVKLLMDWPDSRNGRQYVAGNLLTTDAGTETGLVNAKMATSNLTGGTNYVAPVPQTQYKTAQVVTDAGGAVTISKMDYASQVVMQKRRFSTALDSVAASIQSGKHTTLLDWTDTANIAAAGAGGDVTRIANADMLFPNFGASAMRIKHCSSAATINGLLNYARYNWPTRTTLSGVPTRLAFWAYKAQGTGKANVVVRLYGGASANAADSYAAVEIDDVGPQLVVLDASSFPGNNALAGGIDSIRFCENPNVPLGEKDVVYIGHVYSATKGKAYLCLTFDDGKLTNYTQAKPLLDGYGFKATFYCIGSRLDTPGYMSMAQALELQTSGHTIGNHTWSHPVGFLNASLDQLVTYLGQDGANHIYKITNSYDGEVVPHLEVAGNVFDITGATGGWASGLNSSNNTAFYQNASNQFSDANYGLIVRNVLSATEFDFVGRGSPGVAAGSTTLVNTFEPAYRFGLRKLPTYDAIYAEIKANADYMEASGITGWRHFAYNQGAWDKRTTDAARSAGMVTTRGTSPRVNNLQGGFRSYGYDASYAFGGYEPAPTNNFTSSGTPGATAAKSTAMPYPAGGMSLPGCYASSDFSDKTTWGARLDAAIASGGVVMVLQHNVKLSDASVPGTQTYCLDQLCQAAADREGLIEVVTLEQLEQRVLFGGA